MAKRPPLPDVLGNILSERPNSSTLSSTPEKHNTSVPSVEDTDTVQKVPSQASPLVNSASTIEDENETAKTKATFYLSREVTQALEDTWIYLRQRGGKGRPTSKSILVEAALRRTLEELKQNGIDVSRTV